MLKYNPDYKSRFRILKGGKISLVVSTLLVSSAMITPVCAETNTISNATTSEYVLNGAFYDLEITSTGSITTADTNGISVNTLNTNITNNNDIIVAPIANPAHGIIVYDTMNGHIINNATALIDARTVGNRKAFGVEFADMTSNASLVNSGTIQAVASAAAYGVYVHNNVYGTITNNVGGTISAESTDIRAVAIDLYHGMEAGSQLVNSGTIKGVSTRGAAYGIYMDDWVGGTITNNIGGEISAESTSGTAYAIDLYYGMETDSQLVNSGTIKAVSTDGSAYGIYLDNPLAGVITNNVGGTISAESTSRTATAINLYYGMEAGSQLINSGTIEAVSTNGYAYGVNLYDPIHGTISNHAGGIISAESTNQVAKAIVSYRAMEADSQLINSGTIKAVSGSHAYGIYLHDNIYGTITNNVGGIISAESTLGTASAVRLKSGMQIGSQLINSGTIEAASTSNYAYGIIFADSMQGTITNNVEGVISANSSTGAYGIYNGYGLGADASLINNGTIEGKIDGELNKLGYSLYITQFNTGIIDNTATGKLYGNIYISGTQTFTNNGLISLPHNADNDFIQNFHQTSTGILEIGLMSDHEGMTYSKFYTDTAVFDEGSTLAVNVLTASNDQAFLLGARLNNVVSATSSLTVNGTLHITDNSALLDFEYVVDGRTIDLNIVQGTDSSGNDVTIESSTINGSGNKNAQSSAKALQTILDVGNSPEMDNYFAALNTLGTDAEVARAVASTTPVTANASVTANTQIMNGVQGIVEMRQNSVMGGGMNSGDASLADKNLWVKLYGSKGTQDNKDGINGFDVKAYGLGLGADAEIAPKQRLGAAFFYTDAKVDVNNMPQTSDLKVYTAMLYGNVPMNANTDFLYQAGYSWQKTESERTILPTYDHAKADYTSKTASLDLKVMQTYKMNDSIEARPLVEITYRHFTNPSYSESGAGAMNLQTDKFISSQFITSGGAIIDYKLDKDSKLITDLRLGYDWHHDSQTVTASYQGASGVDFTTNGIDNGGWQYDIGLGYETTKVIGGEINFMYNYQGQGSSFDNHVLSAKYVYKF